MSSTPEPADTRADDDVDAPVVDARHGDPGLVTRLAEAMLHAGEVSKRGRNADQGYNFASAEDILAAVRRPLLERGIILTAQPRNYTEHTIKSQRGTEGTRVVIAVDYTFRVDGGELLIEDWRGEGQDYGDKAYGKAYTNAVKTFIRSEWLLPTDTGDDPEASSSGERLAAGAAPELAPWARPATAARKAELVAALEVLIGRPRAKDLGRTVAETLGVMPDVVVSFAKGLAAHYALEAPGDVADRHRAAFDATAAAATRAEQDAAAEAPDAEPEEEAEQPPPGVGANLDGEDVAPADSRGLSDRPESNPAEDAPAAPAGSVPMPERKENISDVAYLYVLREAGCICPQPLKTDEHSAELDDACPLNTHGIPF